MWNDLEKDIFSFGGLPSILAGDKVCTNYIESGEVSSLENLNKKIERRIRYYRLDSLLLKIHNVFLSKEYPPFIAGMMTKYAMLNCNTYDGFDPVYDDEFSHLCRMIIEYSIEDPEFDEELGVIDDSKERWSSILLRKIGNQVRWHVPLDNMLGRTLFIFREMDLNDDKLSFIKELVQSEFEDRFGLNLLDFIKIGFVLYSGSITQNGMDRNYFEIARTQSIAIPSDDIVKIGLKQVACDPKMFKYICKERESGEDNLRAYEFNPLFQYPLIRPWNDSGQESPTKDKFIAPIPRLVMYRFTTGLYYQLFNTFGTKFATAFGYLFEAYVGILLKWYQLSDVVLSEADIKKYLKECNGGEYRGKIVDWAIFSKDGVILIECKAIKYSQDIYERGLNADKNTVFDQIDNAIVQLNEFERQIPKLCNACGIEYADIMVQKIIVTFEPLLGLKEGPLREWINEKHKEYKTDWDILWVYELEKIQPYITRGMSLWSFLINHRNEEYIKIDTLVLDMQSKTGARYSDGALFKYESKMFKELLENVKKNTHSKYQWID